jgi:glycolate oxidase FAD binding subunit
MTVPAELAAACADTESAGPADAIAGRRARYVAAPASTDEASALLRAAAGLGLTVVPRGAGLLQHWGNPPDSCDLIVDTRRLDRVIEHLPGDFTVTVQAGVRLPRLAEMLQAADQSLQLIPPRRAWTGTVGGIVATNAAGLLRFRYGTPRDQLIGITAVRADGRIVRGGDAATGRDLARLFAGSYGTLGLITEVTFRVHPLPRGSAGVGFKCADPDEAARIVGIVAADSWLAPSGIELGWRSADNPIWVTVVVERDTEDYEERVNQLHVLAGRGPMLPIDRAKVPRQVPPAVAQAVQDHRDQILDPPAETATLVRTSFPPEQLANALTAIHATSAASGLDTAIEGSAGVGVLDVKVPGEMPAATVAQFVVALSTELPAAARIVLLSAPGQVRELTRNSVQPLSVDQSIKDEFDPEHRMAPGRLAEPA